MWDLPPKLINLKQLTPVPPGAASHKIYCQKALLQQSNHLPNPDSVTFSAKLNLILIRITSLAV